MKKTVVIFAFVVAVFTIAIGYSTGTGRFYEMPDQMIFYADGEMCEITDPAAMETFLTIANRYQKQINKEWTGVFDFNLNAMETDADILNQFPGSRVIKFVYENEDDYFLLDQHCSISILDYDRFFSTTNPDATYLALTMISGKTYHCYSQEMLNAAEEFHLYDYLE